MVESERAGFRRDCGVVRVSGPRNGRAGCGRIAQAALCGALVSVALVQPNGRATRTDKGADARLDVFWEGERDAPGAATHALAGGASAGRGSASLEN